MTIVFIGGSRSLSRLNDIIRTRIDNAVRQNLAIIIGDANGVDKAVQSYLASKEYKNVTIYCTGEHCRNNVGNWPTKNIRIDRQKKDFEFYVAKDQEMARTASYGLMLWDGKSKGTLNNIVGLVRQEKKVLAYFSPDKSFHVVKSHVDLADLVRRCHTSDQQRFKREFLDSSQIAGSQQAFDLFPTP